jgi:hypothetical protein
MIKLFRQQFAKFRRSEIGTASLEFALSVPIVLVIFASSFESGLLMLRSIMLDQAVDRTVRELRLGHYLAPTADLLKDEVCKRGVILKDCKTNILIEMTRISTANWTMPTTPVQCVDREEDVNPVTALQIGQQNDIMMVRICVIQDAILPAFGLAPYMELDGEGGYALITTTAYVTEPS